MIMIMITMMKLSQVGITSMMIYPEMPMNSDSLAGRLSRPSPGITDNHDSRDAATPRPGRIPAGGPGPSASLSNHIRVRFRNRRPASEPGPESFIMRPLTVTDWQNFNERAHTHVGAA